MAQQALIRLLGVEKIYGSGEGLITALDRVTLTVNRGEFVSIVGPSGSGKSTLMNILGCLDAPSAGQYILGGRDVTLLCDEALSAIRNREIGFIFQGFNLIESLTALENVELPLLYRHIPRTQRRASAKAALARVGLSARAEHRPNQMSGGQQQRVAIARAIAALPPIILADEPTGNLDSAAGEQVFSILHALHNEGRTVILITHDEALAAKTCRIVRVRDGNIVQDTALFQPPAA